MKLLQRLQDYEESHDERNTKATPKGCADISKVSKLDAEAILKLFRVTMKLYLKYQSQTVKQYHKQQNYDESVSKLSKI